MAAVNRAVLSTSGQRGRIALPAERDERLRVLVVTNNELGWRAYADSIEATTGRREDVDAVHVRLALPRWARAAGARPFGWRPWGVLDPHFRRAAATRLVLHRWLAVNVDVRQFDVVHVTPQLIAPAISSMPVRPPMSVGLDATALQAKAQRRSIDPARAARRYRPLLALERQVVERADLLVCLSRWVRDELRRQYGVGDSRALVVPPSIPVAGGRRTRDEPSRPVRLAFVGNDWERKGGPRLLRWHQAHLVGRAELHVCSNGAPVDRTLPDVVWHGAVPRAELLADVLPSMHALVLPTRSDMSPWAVAEATSLGLPVVTSDVGGIGELVVDGETGCLLQPDDEDGFVRAITRLVDDDAWRDRLGDQALRRAGEVLDHARLGDQLVERWHALRS
jgi:glycosyltransferase involved in cell wall biosynthesis